MKKELLTAEGIKKDLYKHFFSKVRDILLAILIIPIANIIILNVILFFCDPCSSFELVFSIIFCATCFLLVSYDLTTVIIGMISIKKENYTITNDWVVDKKEKTYGTRVSTAKPYRLIFAKSGTYNIPCGENYRWAKLFATSDKTLYEYTDINDDFYIISVRKQKNIIAYNKKHFDLEDKA